MPIPVDSSVDSKYASVTLQGPDRHPRLFCSVPDFGPTLMGSAWPFPRSLLAQGVI